MPTARVTIARADPFDGVDAAEAWVADLGSDEGRRQAELDGAVTVLNRVLRAHRAAAADPLVREVGAEQALVVRIGVASGDAIAAGAAVTGLEPLISRGHRRRRRSEALVPQTRLAAVLGGRERQLVAEELVLRARLDLDVGDERAAALQARIALEALIAELGAIGTTGAASRRLAPHRNPIAQAANAALDGEPAEGQLEAIGAAVAQMEREVRGHRLGGGADSGTNRAQTGPGAPRGR